MRPIVFFDLETTGVDKSNDRIVEIAIVRFDGDKEYKFETLVNPLVEIPTAASDVHGITNDKVKDSPTFKDIAKKVHNILSGCDLAGYNSNSFDIPFIVNELQRSGFVLDLDAVNFIDVCAIFKRKEERTLTAAVKFFLNKEHEGAHGAMADVQATINVFKAQKERYSDLPADLSELNLYCNYDQKRADLAGNFAFDADGDYILNFGKHKGQKAKNQISYLQWMNGQDFMSDTKAIIKKFI